MKVWISSLPRCGSTYFTRCLLGEEQGEYMPLRAKQGKTGVIKNHLPPPKELPEGYKCIYLFGEVIPAVVSTFFNRFDKGHFKNCGYRGDRRNIFDEDFLNYEDTFDAWLETPYPTIFIRYEKMHENRRLIEMFLDREIQWLPWKDRTTNIYKLPMNKLRIIKKTYSGLIEKIKTMPDIMILNNYICD